MVSMAFIVIWTDWLERPTREAESRMFPTSAYIATIVPANSAIATRPSSSAKPS